VKSSKRRKPIPPEFRSRDLSVTWIRKRSPKDPIYISNERSVYLHIQEVNALTKQTKERNSYFLVVVSPFNLLIAVRMHRHLHITPYTDPTSYSGFGLAVPGTQVSRPVINFTVHRMFCNFRTYYGQLQIYLGTSCRLKYSEVLGAECVSILNYHFDINMH
jgi:hypothetical protein